MGRNDGFTSVQFLILLVCEAHSDTSVRPWARGPDMLAESVHPDPSLILLCFPSLWRPGGAGPQAGSVGGEGRGGSSQQKISSDEMKGQVKAGNRRTARSSTSSSRGSQPRVWLSEEGANSRTICSHHYLNFVTSF